MSGQRSIANVGVVLDAEDGQRWMDDAAKADDLVTELLLMPGTVSSGSYTKRVVPLATETSSKGNELLVVPSSTNGKVTVKPAWYGAAQVESGSSSAPQIVLAGRSRVSTDSTTIAAGGGVARWDLIYMTMARATSVTQQRYYRDTSDNETAVTVALATDVTFTIGKVSSTVSLSDALAQLPSDSASAWNFPLAVVVVASGYLANGVIYQNSSGGSTYITQQWSRGGISRDRVNELSPVDYGSVPAGNQPTTASLLTSRWQGKVEKHLFLKLKNADGSTTFTVDTSIDWRGRWLRVWYHRPSSPGTTNNTPETVADTAGSNGSVAGVAHGYSDTYGGTCAVYFRLSGGNSDSSELQMGFQANATTGALEFKPRMTAGGTTDTFVVYDNTNGDIWSFFIEASPQVLKNL